MNDALRHEKYNARKEIKSVIDRTRRADRAAWSARIAEHVTGLAEWGRCPMVLAFLPMYGEVNTTGMINLAFSTGKTVGVPRMYGHHIEFHKIESIEGPWDLHPYGVREPPETLPVIDPCDGDTGDIFVITPGLSFDVKGRRLGFGKGYYDRMIDRCRSKTDGLIFFAGVCFSVQLVETVPTGPYDRLVDAIVTEDGLVFHGSRQATGASG